MSAYSSLPMWAVPLSVILGRAGAGCRLTGAGAFGRERTPSLLARLRAGLWSSFDASGRNTTEPRVGPGWVRADLRGRLGVRAGVFHQAVVDRLPADPALREPECNPDAGGAGRRGWLGGRAGGPTAARGGAAVAGAGLSPPKLAQPMHTSPTHTMQARAMAADRGLCAAHDLARWTTVSRTSSTCSGSAGGAAGTSHGAGRATGRGRGAFGGPGAAAGAMPNRLAS